MPRISTVVAILMTSFISPGQAADIDVNQAGQKFSTPSVTLKRGDTLHFLNHDDVIHNIMIIGADEQPEDQGLQKPGEQITKKFDQNGTFQVRCAIHPRMKMKIEIQ